ncbi:hypothetical protein E2C01_035633 [Portunus trituberculatus]|uniref:Uncharacterized protein n=1 Tax=Portunus trituberculatus TaxID=210409 RepID=A0A5B7F4P8_PORTR|nr:hypothetical protein [Portunus trituberculatus]
MVVATLLRPSSRRGSGGVMITARSGRRVMDGQRNRQANIGNPPLVVKDNETCYMRRLTREGPARFSHQ